MSAIFGIGLVWPLIWTVVLAPIVYFVYQVASFLVDVRRRGRAVDKFPAEPKHWLWGHIHLFPGPNEAGLAFRRRQVAKFPRAHGVWVGNYVRPSVVLQHPETVKVILKTSEPKPLGLGIYRIGLPWIGEGLVVSSGSKWARNRKLLTPAFHFDVLKQYIPVKNRATELLLEKMEECSKAGKSMEMFDSVSLLTFDIILRCAFSYQNDVQTTGETHPYLQAVTALGDLWFKRAINPLHNFDFIYRFTQDYKDFQKACDYVHSVSSDVIQKRQRILNEVGLEAARRGRYLDFLDILLTAKDDEGQGLSDQEIRDEVDTFLFEGNDTTASALSWILYSLAQHQEHQELCQEEIDKVLTGRPDDNIEWDDLAEFPYLTMCIKEAIRLHSPVPFIERELTSELTIDGVTMPRGSIVDVQIYCLHQNPTIWEEPMEYRPSRFLPENFSKMDQFAFVPFSAGPRNCIGKHFAMHELKIVVARVLRRFRLELDPERKVEKKLAVVMKTQNGMYMKIFHRNI